MKRSMRWSAALFAGLLGGFFALSLQSAALAQSAEPKPPPTILPASQPAGTTKPAKMVRRLKEGEEIEIPPPPPPAPVSGPLRVELYAILEQRVKINGDAPDSAPKPMSRVFFKVTGEGLYDIFRMSRLVVDEFKDDAGGVMFDPATISEADKSSMNPLANGDAVRQQGFAMLDLTCKLPDRGAKKVASGKGYVNVLVGESETQVRIENPIKAAGAEIDNEMLKKFGIKARLLKLGEETTDPSGANGVALRIEAGDESIKQVDFYDDWMRKVATRGRPGTAKDGKPYTFYMVAAGTINNDWTMLVTMYGKVEKKKLEFSIKDVELP